MGACLGVCSLLSCVSCLCGSAPCLLCGCCPSAKNSTISRLLFTFFLFLGTLVSIIMIIPGVEKELHKLPGFCEGSGSVLGVQTKVDCSSFLGHKAVYRMGFAMAAFFCLFAVLMVCVRSSKDPRAALQNGFWFFKFLVLVGITVGAFYIPDGTFTSVWFYFGVVGSFLFILIQLVLLIDLAHSWSQRWLHNAEEGSAKGWYAALCTVTFIFYAASITAIVLLYVYYTKPEGCTEGKAFISINLILCLIVSVVSILPKIQEAQPHSGLLQASLITLYTIYITWAALANVPSQRCNPTLLLRNSTGSATATEPLTTWWDAPSIVGLVIFILCTLFISLRSSDHPQVNKLMLTEESGAGAGAGAGIALRDVPHRGAGAQDGPRGAAPQDAPRRARLRPQLRHLRRTAADHSVHPEEAGQYMSPRDRRDDLRLLSPGTAAGAARSRRRTAPGGVPSAPAARAGPRGVPAVTERSLCREQSPCPPRAAAAQLTSRPCERPVCPAPSPTTARWK